MDIPQGVPASPYAVPTLPMIKVGDGNVLPIPFSNQELDDLIAVAVERQIDIFVMMRTIILDDLAR